MRKVCVSYMEAHKPGIWNSKVFYLNTDSYGEAIKRIKEYVKNHMNVLEWTISYNKLMPEKDITFLDTF